MTTFYDDLAEHYHLMFKDWGSSVLRQASILGPLLEQRTGLGTAKVLNCACGIGTQTLGLALKGHHLFGSDLSQHAIVRAQHEARRLGVEVQFQVADMRDLSSIPEQEFDIVLAGDNAVPHLLSNDDLDLASEQFASKLKPGGIFVATLLVQTRPAMQSPLFMGESDSRRIVHQV